MNRNKNNFLIRERTKKEKKEVIYTAAQLIAKGRRIGSVGVSKSRGRGTLMARTSQGRGTLRARTSQGRGTLRARTS
jgi:hypothetical protein